jgi:MYXO-CTERM domain-containing protein
MMFHGLSMNRTMVAVGLLTLVACTQTNAPGPGGDKPKQPGAGTPAPPGGNPAVGGSCPTCTLAIAPGQAFCVDKKLVEAAAPGDVATLEALQGTPRACQDPLKLCVPAVDPRTQQPTPVAGLCQATPGQPGPTAPGNPGPAAAALAPCGQGRGKCVPTAIVQQQNAQQANNLQQVDCAPTNLCVPNRLVGNPPGSNVQYQSCRADIGLLGQLGQLRGLIGGNGEGLGGLLGQLLGGDDAGLDLRGSCLDIKNRNNPDGLINTGNEQVDLLGQGDCPVNEICALCNAPEIGILGGQGGPTNAPGCAQLYPGVQGYYPSYGYYDDINVYDPEAGGDVLGCSAAGGATGGAYSLLSLLGLLVGWRRRRR